jgi:transcriptional regulator with XRE-family HTH domain
MHFGEKVRSLRTQSEMTQQQLADEMHVSVSYISKVENGRLHFGEYPSEKFIEKLSAVLQVNLDELLLLAEKVPPGLLSRIRSRPDAFRLFASLDDRTMDLLIAQIGRERSA